MPTDTIQPIQEILNRWILIGQALVGSIGALAFVIAFLWTKIGRFKARTHVPGKQPTSGTCAWRRLARPAATTRSYVSTVSAA